MTRRVCFEELAKFIRLSKYKESYYAVIAAYMDESFDMKQSGMFVVGGLMGRGVAIFELENRWEVLRKRSDIDIEYFKASECQFGKNQFAKFVAEPKNIQPSERERLESISCEFGSTIVKPRFDDSYLTLFGVGVIQEDFFDVIKDPYAKAILGPDPYRLAYDLAMIECAASMKKLSTTMMPAKPYDHVSHDRVSFVCDETEQYSPNAEPAYRGLKQKNPKAEEYMASYGSADEKECQPLQAADAVVYEIRRVLQLSVGFRKGEVRKQFRILSDAGAVFMILKAEKQTLLQIVAENTPGEPFNLDMLMDSHLLYKDVDLNI